MAGFAIAPARLLFDFAFCAEPVFLGPLAAGFPVLIGGRAMILNSSQRLRQGNQWRSDAPQPPKTLSTDSPGCVATHTLIDRIQPRKASKSKIPWKLLHALPFEGAAQIASLLNLLLNLRLNLLHGKLLETGPEKLGGDCPGRHEPLACVTTEVTALWSSLRDHRNRVTGCKADVRSLRAQKLPTIRTPRLRPR